MTAPLTVEQRNWLRVNAVLPPLFAVPMVVAVSLVLAFVYKRFGSAMPVKVFAGLGVLLLVAVTAGVALHVLNNVRDLRRGVADVATARLVSKHERGRSPRTHHAELEGLGKLIVPHEIYVRLAVGQSYRVAFSPRTRRCWTAEAR